MTEAASQNPFAPPRAHVADPFTSSSAMVAASRWSRLGALLIDVAPMIVAGILGALMVPGLYTGKFDPTGGRMVAFGVVVLVFGLVMAGWGIWSIVLLYTRGQTVGKMFLGLRVVRMDGSRVALARFFFLRWLPVVVLGAVAGAIAGAMGQRYAGNVVSVVDGLLIFGAARRCLHDLIADTQVVTAASSPEATLAGADGR